MMQNGQSAMSLHPRHAAPNCAQHPRAGHPCAPVLRKFSSEESLIIRMYLCTQVQFGHPLLSRSRSNFLNPYTTLIFTTCKFIALSCVLEIRAVCNPPLLFFD